MGSSSGYYYYSLMQDPIIIWIAQKEGRGKDGLDQTDLGDF